MDFGNLLTAANKAYGSATIVGPHNFLPSAPQIPNTWDKSPFNPGDTVSIKQAPFENMFCKIQCVNQQKLNVTIRPLPIDITLPFDFICRMEHLSDFTHTLEPYISL